MIVATPISTCKNLACKSEIHVDDVYREKDVRTAPGHVVLMYKCSACGLAGRIVGENEVWQDRQREAVYNRYEVDRYVNAFSEDLDVLVETPADLENIWNSYGPPLVDPSNRKCMCKDCDRRYGPR